VRTHCALAYMYAHPFISSQEFLNLLMILITSFGTVEVSEFRSHKFCENK